MRRCSDIKYWQRALIELKLLFTARGYTNQLIGDSLKDVTFVSPENRLVGGTPALTGRKFFFKTVFDDRRPAIKPLLTANWVDLCGDPACETVFGRAEVTLCFKNKINLKKLKTRSALKGDVKMNVPALIPGGRCYRILRVTAKCGKVGCLTCNALEERSCIISTATRERHPITTRMTCTSSYIVYVTRCVVCDR